MKSALRFGTSGELELDLSPGALVADCRGPRGKPLTDVAAATMAALLQPLAFPQLGQAVVPGDRVTLALGEGVPQSDSVLKAVSQHLMDHGVSLGDITVLRVAGEADAHAETPSGEIRSYLDAATGLKTQVHRPDRRDELAYLSADDEGESIYLNRLLCDADAIVPIGRFRADDEATLDHMLFPAFADNKAQARRPLTAEVPASARPSPKTNVPEVAWKLGVQFTLQVVPAAGDGALHVLGGDPDAVFARGRELCRDAWRFDVPRRAGAVVAAIEGEESQQTWAGIGRAAEVASACVEEGGAVVICCEVSAPPGEGVQMLGREEDPGRTLKRLAKRRPPDAAAAAQLVKAAETAKLYLLSKLDDSIVEDLGLAPVSCPEDLARLVKRYDSCILIANAQHVAIELD